MPRTTRFIVWLTPVLEGFPYLVQGDRKMSSTGRYFSFFIFFLEISELNLTTTDYHTTYSNLYAETPPCPMAKYGGYQALEWGVAIAWGVVESLNIPNWKGHIRTTESLQIEEGQHPLRLLLWCKCWAVADRKIIIHNSKKYEFS